MGTRVLIDITCTSMKAPKADGGININNAATRTSSHGKVTSVKSQKEHGLSDGLTDKRQGNYPTRVR